MVAFVSLKREAIHRAVRQMYTAVARQPDREYHFPTGRHAAELLGYPADVLADVPDEAVESFAGVGYPFRADIIRPGDRVLDIGSGSGTDALISAACTGPDGHVYALDMTDSMREKLQEIATAHGIDNLEVLAGDAEQIPLPDASVDVITSNGVFNLVPDKARAFAELFRVLKPGGRLQIADIALARPVSERFRNDPEMWAECVVGAVEEARYFEMLREAGFDPVEKLNELDYFGFSGHDKTREVATLFNAHAIALRASRPLEPASEGLLRQRRRSLFRMVRELGLVLVSVSAWLVCAGATPLIAAMSAVGAGWLTAHAYMFPAFALFLGFAVWLIRRSGSLRAEQRPYRLGLASAVLAIVTTWISLAGIYPPAGWLSYAGIAGVIGASLWAFLLARRPGDCLEEMIREAELRDRRAPVPVRAVRFLAALLLVAVLLFAMYATMPPPGTA